MKIDRNTLLAKIEADAAAGFDGNEGAGMPDIGKEQCRELAKMAARHVDERDAEIARLRAALERLADAALTAGIPRDAPAFVAALDALNPHPR